MKMGSKGKWLFIILPLLYFILSCIYIGGIKQFYISHYDPAYAYLMNGTNLASGHFRIGNIEHPGTPVDIFAAIIIFIRHLFTGNTVLYQDVLLHPESYLFTCSIVLALLLSLVTYYVGNLVFRHSGNILLALLFQLSSLFYSDIVSMSILLSADSFIAIIGILFMAYLYVNTIEAKETSNKNVVLFGLFTALLFATKIYCAPIAILVLLMIKKWNQRIVYLVSTGIFTLILLFPLYNQLRNWAGFIKSEVFHSGPYGQGNSGVINASLYKNNLIELFTTHYLFTAVFAFVILAFIAILFNMLKERKFSFISISPIAGILIYFTLFTLLIIKQYKVDCPNPVTHIVVTVTKFYYFILLITCFPLAIAISYKILSPYFSFQFFKSPRQKLLYSVFILFTIWGLRDTYKTCYDVRNQNISFEKTNSFLNGWKNTALIIVANGGDQVRAEPALLLGIGFSGKWDMPQYFDFLKKTYPNTYLFAVWFNNDVNFWGSKTDMTTILKKHNQALVYISGADSVSEQTTLSKICDGTPETNKSIYKKIYSSDNKYENIYLVKADTLR